MKINKLFTSVDHQICEFNGKKNFLNTNRGLNTDNSTIGNTDECNLFIDCTYYLIYNLSYLHFKVFNCRNVSIKNSL